MRELSWKVFVDTGDLDAYLLYKDLELIQFDDELYPNGELKVEEED